MKYAVQGKDTHAENWKKNPELYKEAREKVIYDRVLHTTAAGTSGELDGLSAETGLFNNQTRLSEGIRCNLGPTPSVLPKEKDLTIYALEAEVFTEDLATFLALTDEHDIVIEDSNKKELLRRRVRECPQVGGMDGMVAIDGNAAATDTTYFRNGGKQAFAVPLRFPICLTGGSQLIARLESRNKAVDAANEPYAVVNAYAGRKTLEVRLHCLEYVKANAAA